MQCSMWKWAWTCQTQMWFLWCSFLCLISQEIINYMFCHILHQSSLDCQREDSSRPNNISDRLICSDSCQWIFSDLFHFLSQMVLIPQQPLRVISFRCGFQNHLAYLHFILSTTYTLTAEIEKDVWYLFLCVVLPLQSQPPGTQRHLTAIRTREKCMKTNTFVWRAGFLAFVKCSIRGIL